MRADLDGLGRASSIGITQWPTNFRFARNTPPPLSAATRQSTVTAAYSAAAGLWREISAVNVPTV